MVSIPIAEAVTKAPPGLMRRVMMPKVVKYAAVQAALFILGPYILGPIVRRVITRSHIKKLFRRQIEMELALYARKYAHQLGISEAQFIERIGYLARKRMKTPHIKHAIEDKMIEAKNSGAFEGNIKDVEIALRTIAHALLALLQIRMHLGEIKRMKDTPSGGALSPSAFATATPAVDLAAPPKTGQAGDLSNVQINDLSRAVKQSVARAEEKKEWAINILKDASGILEYPDYVQLQSVARSVDQQLEKMKTKSKALERRPASSVKPYRDVLEIGRNISVISDMMGDALAGELAPRDIKIQDVKRETKLKSIEDLAGETLHLNLTDMEPSRFTTTERSTMATTAEIKLEYDREVKRLADRIMSFVAERDQLTRTAEGQKPAYERYKADELRKLDPSLRGLVMQHSAAYANNIRKAVLEILNKYGEQSKKLSGVSTNPDVFKVQGKLIGGKVVYDVLYKGFDSGSFIEGEAMPALKKLERLADDTERYFKSQALTWQKKEDEQADLLFENPSLQNILSAMDAGATGKPHSTAKGFLLYVKSLPQDPKGLSVLLTSKPFQGIEQYGAFHGDDAKIARAFDVYKKYKKTRSLKPQLVSQYLKERPEQAKEYLERGQIPGLLGQYVGATISDMPSFGQTYGKPRMGHVDFSHSPGMHLDITRLSNPDVYSTEDLLSVYNTYYAFTDPPKEVKGAQRKESKSALEGMLGVDGKIEKKAIKAEILYRIYETNKNSKNKTDQEIASKAKTDYKRIIINGRFEDDIDLEDGDEVRRVSTSVDIPQGATKAKDLALQREVETGTVRMIDGLPMVVDKDGNVLGRPDWSWQTVPKPLERTVRPLGKYGVNKRLRQVLGMTADEYVAEQLSNTEVAERNFFKSMYKEDSPPPGQGDMPIEEYAKVMKEWEKDFNTHADEHWQDIKDDLAEEFEKFYYSVVADSFADGTMLTMLASGYKELGGEEGFDRARRAVNSAFKFAAGTEAPQEVTSLLFKAWDKQELPDTSNVDIAAAIQKVIEPANPYKGVTGDFWVLDHDKNHFMDVKKRQYNDKDDTAIENMYRASVKKAILDGKVHEFAMMHPYMGGRYEVSGAGWETPPEEEEPGSGQRTTSMTAVKEYHPDDIVELFKSAFGTEPPKEFMVSVEQSVRTGKVPEEFHDTVSAKKFFDRIGFQLPRTGFLDEAAIYESYRKDDGFDYVWEVLLDPGRGLGVGARISTDYVTEQERKKLYYELRSKYINRIPEIMKVHKVSREEAEEYLNDEIEARIVKDPMLANELRRRVESSPIRVAGAIFGTFVGGTVHTILHDPIRRHAVGLVKKQWKKRFHESINWSGISQSIKGGAIEGVTGYFKNLAVQVAAGSVGGIIGRFIKRRQLKKELMADISGELAAKMYKESKGRPIDHKELSRRVKEIMKSKDPRVRKQLAIHVKRFSDIPADDITVTHYRNLVKRVAGLIYFHMWMLPIAKDILTPTRVGKRLGLREAKASTSSPRVFQSPEAAEILLGGAIKFGVARLAAHISAKIFAGWMLSGRAKNLTRDVIKQDLFKKLRSSGYDPDRLTVKQRDIVISEIERKLESPLGKRRIEYFKTQLEKNPHYLEDKKSMESLVKGITNLIVLPPILYKVYRGWAAVPRMPRKHLRMISRKTG